MIYVEERSISYDLRLTPTSRGYLEVELVGEAGVELVVDEQMVAGQHQP